MQNLSITKAAHNSMLITNALLFKLKWSSIESQANAEIEFECMKHANLNCKCLNNKKNLMHSEHYIKFHAQNREKSSVGE